jgi:glyoxylase-like metal-dependent hydrolase (beta-lactamase superfamily II)
MELRRLTVGVYQTNSYVLSCDRTQSLIVDPGGDPATLLSAIAGTQLAAILLTHGHTDHTAALVELHLATGAPIGVHPQDAGLLPILPHFALQDGKAVSFGTCKVRVRHLPGHTPGSVGLGLSQGLWLVGDAIFPGGPGHTESPAQFAQLMQTLRQRIFTLPPETQLLPGHGPATTVRQEAEPFHAFLQRSWAEDAYGDVRWDTGPARASDESGRDSPSALPRASSRDG